MLCPWQRYCTPAHKHPYIRLLFCSIVFLGQINFCNWDYLIFETVFCLNELRKVNQFITPHTCRWHLTKREVCAQLKTHIHSRVYVCVQTSCIRNCLFCTCSFSPCLWGGNIFCLSLQIQYTTGPLDNPGQVTVLCLHKTHLVSINCKCSLVSESSSIFVQYLDFFFLYICPNKGDLPCAPENDAHGKL